MRLWWRNLLDRVDSLSLRERVLVLVGLLALIGVLWDGLLMRPLERSGQRLEPEIAGLRSEIARINASIEELAGKGSLNPDQVLKEQLTQTRTGIADLDKQLGGLTQGLIAPEEMIEVLKTVIARTPPLRIVGLRTLNAEPLAALMPGEVLPSQVYRHGVELELEGGYLDLVEFLRAFDTMPWRFYWHELELDVTAHPLLRVRLTVHTLGREEAWIGV